jgi:hypothetical protein
MTPYEGGITLNPMLSTFLPLLDVFMSGSTILRNNLHSRYFTTRIFDPVLKYSVATQIAWMIDYLIIHRPTREDHGKNNSIASPGVL